MKYTTKNLLIVFVGILVVACFATATNLTITSYTDNDAQDYQNDDTLQLGLAKGGIMAETFVCSDPAQNPISFGTTTSNAGGFGNYGGTFGANDWYPTSIRYNINSSSRWFNDNILKDITIYVYASDTARRHYDFQVQYLLADSTGIYRDVMTYLPVEAPEYICTHIADPNVTMGNGTKIEITDINVANVSQVVIWAHPIEDGLNKFSTTIAEIDINFESCSSYPVQDINADCNVDIDDLAIIAADWLVQLE
jgi:hypothetical protein